MLKKVKAFYGINYINYMFYNHLCYTVYQIIIRRVVSIPFNSISQQHFKENSMGKPRMIDS